MITDDAYRNRNNDLPDRCCFPADGPAQPATSDPDVRAPLWARTHIHAVLRGKELTWIGDPVGLYLAKQAETLRADIGTNGKDLAKHAHDLAVTNLAAGTVANQNQLAFVHQPPGPQPK